MTNSLIGAFINKMWIKSKSCGEILKEKLFVFQKQIQMQDSYSELIRLLLPEIIVEYFELTSYKIRR